MFEKEAEERARKLEEKQTLGVYDNDEDLARDEGFNNGEVCGYENGFQEGAEFGYNKANEWHNLKTEKPPLRKEVLWCIDNQLWLGQLCESWIDFGEWDIDSVLFNDYEIAWKEIVPLNESK